MAQPGATARRFDDVDKQHANGTRARAQKLTNLSSLLYWIASFRSCIKVGYHFVDVLCPDEHVPARQFGRSINQLPNTHPQRQAAE